jgi:hypothetical protein
MKAFPTTKPLDSWGDPNQGMDLRDYFAAKALTAIALNQGSIGTEDYTFEEVALDAYLIADAMMKARME